MWNTLIAYEDGKGSEVLFMVSLSLAERTALATHIVNRLTARGLGPLTHTHGWQLLDTSSVSVVIVIQVVGTNRGIRRGQGRRVCGYVGGDGASGGNSDVVRTEVAAGSRRGGGDGGRGVEAEKQAGSIINWGDILFGGHSKSVRKCYPGRVSGDVGGGYFHNNSNNVTK